jgi:predicted DNA-binding protein with PD1-like motif
MHNQAKSGRIFVLRLEDGEIIQESIESFAINYNIK